MVLTGLSSLCLGNSDVPVVEKAVESNSIATMGYDSSSQVLNIPKSTKAASAFQRELIQTTSSRELDTDTNVCTKRDNA
jgi:hypothetical protein